MRHFTTGLVLAATTTLLPALAFAGNQEVANEIAKNLRNSGRLSDYKIGVKYQDGTAWLSGRVRSQQQMNTALKLVFQTAGIKRVVNNLTMGSTTAASRSQASTTVRFANVQSKWNGSAAEVPRPIQPISRALAPERMSIAKRLETVLSGGTRQQSGRTSARPATGRSAGRAHQVPSSFNTAPAQRVAALEPRAIPRATPARIPGRPIPVAYTQPVGGMPAAQRPSLPAALVPGGPIPAYVAGVGGGVAPARYDQPHMPNYAWPSYAAYPNYGALTYPRQYSPTAWPFIGPFYPYPQVPLGWRKVTLEWDDGWWMLDFKD